MSSFTLSEQLGKPPNRSWRALARDFGRRLTTPLGATCLAVFALMVGAALAAVLEVPGGELERTREALSATEAQVQDLQSTLSLREAEAERLRAIQAYSAEYDVPADLAASVFDIALAEGLEPAIAFQLVRIESAFERHAVSEAGALGYTQVMPSTARLLKPGVTIEQLFETRTNLRLGFRYLNLLLERYDENMRLALLAYNRGPTRVGSLLAMGMDPANGYADKVMRTVVLP